jgi:hypothetical protein
VPGNLVPGTQLKLKERNQIRWVCLRLVGSFLTTPLPVSGFLPGNNRKRGIELQSLGSKAGIKKKKGPIRPFYENAFLLQEYFSGTGFSVG